MTSAFGISNSRMGHHDYGLSGSGQRGPMPPIRANLEFFGNLSSVNTSVVSGAVAQLGDDSGNGRHFTQATGTARPTYSASDANFGGRPSMAFDGINDSLTRASFAAGTNLATVYAVLRPASTTGDQRVFGQRPGSFANTTLLHLSVSSLEHIFGNPAATFTAMSVGIAINTSYRFAAAVDATAAATAVKAIYLNGTSTGAYSSQLATAGGPFASQPWGIGATDTGSLFYTGSITDILLYSAQHSATQVAQIDAWLKWRNGL